MVGMLGINVYRVFMLVFGIGAMAAGFAGIVNAPVVSLTPDMGESILVQTFVVVVIGGVGSFPGAILGGLIAGEILSLTSMVDPAYSEVMLFAVMTLVLLLRPQGLLGVRGPRLSARGLMPRRRASADRGADRARPDRRALCAAAISASRPTRSTRSWSGACSASASTSCSATPACCRSASRRFTAPAASSRPIC